MSIQLMRDIDDVTGKAQPEPQSLEGGNNASRDAETPPVHERYNARLTVDVTQALRTRIRIAAIRQSKTTKELIRSMLEREFPSDSHDPSGDGS